MYWPLLGQANRISLSPLPPKLYTNALCSFPSDCSEYVAIWWKRSVFLQWLLIQSYSFLISFYRDVTVWIVNTCPHDTTLVENCTKWMLLLYLKKQKNKKIIKLNIVPSLNRDMTMSFIKLFTAWNFHHFTVIANQRTFHAVKIDFIIEMHRKRT